MPKKAQTTPETKAEPDDTGQGRAPMSPIIGTPRFSLTLYFYAVVADSNGENLRRFPAQQTISAETAEEFTQILAEFYQAVADTEPGALVTYEPRVIAGGAVQKGGVATAGAPTSPAPAYPGGGEPPNCPFHGSPITAKQNKRSNAWFWSCSKPSASGSGYCNWKPPELQ